MSAFDRRLTPARPDLAAAHLRGRVEAGRFAEAVAMAVTAPLADMRPAPDEGASLDTQLLHGERVAVYEIARDWAWGQAETDGYVGYLPRSALGPAGPAPTHRVAARAAQVYPEPALKRPATTRLPWPARVAVAGAVRAANTSAPFARLADGSGYVPLPLLAPLDAPAPDWVALCEGLAGTPYLWGGRSGDGLDCSSLIQLALDVAGRPFPRDSDLQAEARAEALAPDAPLSRGDLVFWRGHVGVMLDAERLCHANAFHMAVAVEPLPDAMTRIEAAGEGTPTARRRLDPGHPGG